MGRIENTGKGESNLLFLIRVVWEEGLSNKEYGSRDLEEEEGKENHAVGRVSQAEGRRWEEGRPR